MLQDSIAEELWGESLPATWESAFRNGVTRLRNKLGKEVLGTTSGRYHLNRDAVHVDAWDLLDDAQSPCPGGVELLEYLSGTPFLGVEVSPTIRLMVERIEEARTSLIRAATSHGRPALDGTALAVLRSYQRSNSVDDCLLELVVRAHLQAGETARSLAILDEARREAEADDRLIGSQLTLLDEAIRRQAGPGPLLAHAEVGSAQIQGRLPQALEVALDSKQIGRRSEMHRLLEGIGTSTTTLMLGHSGTGKTLLLAAAARQLVAIGYAVRYAQGDTSGDAPYSTLINAVPEASAEIERVLATATDQIVAQTKCNAILMQHLQSTSRQRACLLVDDGHLIDSHSERFVVFAAAQSAVPISIVIAARPDSAEPGWRHFHQSIADLNPYSLSVKPLGRLEVFELASHFHPSAGPRLLMQLTNDVLNRTGGLPGVARYLIERAEPNSLLLSADEIGDPVNSNPMLGYVRQFDDDQLTVGVAGAVLGKSFDLTEVSALTLLKTTQAKEHLDDLIAAEFVVESTAPDRFVFAHALYREALLSHASPSKRRRLHRLAADLTSSVTRRAQHLAAAVPLVEPSIASEALINAGRHYFSNGSWREAATAFREAGRHCDNPLPIQDMCRFADALDLSGANGSLVREQVFDLCALNSNWSAALSVATSGSQSAERVHGDPRRAKLLERIPTQHLTKQERFRLAAALVRQLTFLDRHDEAVEWADLATSSASSPDERLIAFIHSALLGDAIDPCAPLVVPHDFEQVQDKVIKLRGLQISSLSHLERAEAHVSGQLVNTMRHLTARTDDPYRTWHQAVLEDALLFVNGELTKACENAKTTHLLGDRFGIGDAESAYLAFSFFWRQTTGQLSVLRPNLARYKAAGESLIHHAMTAVIQASEPVRSAASLQILTTFTRSAIASRSMFAVPSLVLAASDISLLADDAMRNAVYQKLEPRSTTSALVANGVIHAGPVDRALAILSSNEAQAIKHKYLAIEVADKQGPLLWRVRCRLDLAVGSEDIHFKEAVELASGTEVMSLIAPA